MSEQEKEQYRQIFNLILSEKGVFAKYPPPARVLALIVAACVTVRQGNDANVTVSVSDPYWKTLTKELEPVAQECLDKKG